MTEMSKSIIDLIIKNKSIKEMASTLGISEKQFYLELRKIIDYGYQIEPTYLHNSDIYYNIIKDKLEKEENTIRIKIPSSIKSFRSLIISDLHTGNIDSDMNLWNIVYEYAVKNGVNIIFICGDILEGTYTSDRKNLKDIYSQIDEFVKNYPYDKNIINVAIFGNHDVHSLHFDGLNVMKNIVNSRYDIAPIGYGKGIVKLKNDKLLLKHKLSVVNEPDIGGDCKIVLVGHGHMMKSKISDRLQLCVPTLSNISRDKGIEILPGFIDMTIEFEKEVFDIIDAKHMVITPKIYQVGETRCRVNELFKNSNDQYSINQKNLKKRDYFDKMKK